MEGISILFTLTVLLLQAPDYVAGRQNIYASACNNNYLNLQCPRNQRIAIKRLFYGVNTAKRCKNRKLGDCCRATQNDCREFDDTVYPKLNNRCSGYEKCSIIVESVPVRSSACQSDRTYTDYMTVIYDCVPIEDIATFCSDDVKRGKVLYLANEEYPKAIKTLKSSCRCVASTEFSNGINLFSIDVLIAPAQFGDRSCSRSMIITDKHAFEKEITCGHRGWFGYRTIYSRTVNNVSLELLNSRSEGTAFLWLEVKATNSNDYVQIHCGESLHRLLVGSHESGESRRADKDTILYSTTTLEPAVAGEPGASSSYGPNSLTSDMAAIVGGIVVAAFFIFTIVIVAIAVHCRRQHKEKNKPTKVELYPAIPPAQLETSSYHHYDYDDEHYCSISRSPLKVSNFSDCPTGNQTFRESCPPAIVTDHDTTKSNDFIEGQALIHHTELPSRDYLSTDERQMNGHKTLPVPSHKSTVNNPFPTNLPPHKRSKSVTFSQPVAKVTPMNSESEESVPEPPTKMSLTYINPDEDYYEFPPPPPLEILELKPNEHLVQPQTEVMDIYAVVNKPKKLVPIIDDDKPYDNVTVSDRPYLSNIDKTLNKQNLESYQIQFNDMGSHQQHKVETGV